MKRLIDARLEASRGVTLRKEKPGAIALRSNVSTWFPGNDLVADCPCDASMNG
ncbi:MAG: hypothetical protein ACAF41_12240 [Leptolyngbya sp. BL-A-14]